MDQQVTITPQPIGSAWCGLYQCEARFFTKDYWYGKRTLVSNMAKAIAARGCPGLQRGDLYSKRLFPGIGVTMS